MKLLPFLFLTTIFFFSPVINAQLSTVVIRHDENTLSSNENSRCSGVLEVAAMGDSGPFTVRIFEASDRPSPSQRPIFNFSLGINEGRPLEKVCAGNYLVVYTNRFGCEFTDNNIQVTECGRGDCCADFGVYQSMLNEAPDPTRCGAGGCQMGLRACLKI